MLLRQDQWTISMAFLMAMHFFAPFLFRAQMEKEQEKKKEKDKKRIEQEKKEQKERERKENDARKKFKVNLGRRCVFWVGFVPCT